MKKAIITTSILALFVGAAMAVEASNDVISKTGSIHGGYVNEKSDITITDSSYNNISLTANGGEGNNAVVYGGIVYVNNGTETTNTINNSTFSNISVSAYWQGQGTAIAVDGSHLSVNNSSFLNNTTSSEIGVNSIGSMGGAISIFNSTNTTISNSTFDGNKSLGIGSLWGYGGAVYIKSSIVSISNSILKDNAVSNDVFEGSGGAIYLQTSSNLSITDSEITGNVASSGGAIRARSGSLVTINVSADKSFSYTGNKAADDESGGFINMSSSSSNFNVAENAKLTIGDGTVGYDSIAGDASSTINKAGAGSLVVNSSMEYFTGSLNVEAGKMEANNGLGAKAITIANGATLGLQINGNNTLSNSSLVFTNNGTLVLTSKVGLASGDYTVSATEIADYGVTKTYGGVLVGNIFTVAESQKVEVGAEVSTVVENNGIVEIKTDESTTVSMAFNAESATVNKVVEATETLVESIGADFVQMGAYEFDVSMEEGDTVVLSFYVGDSTLKASDFSIFHKSEGGQWGKAEDVSGISYDGEYLSFVVSHFSSYGYAAVPEPSTYAAIFGAIALGFVIYRRRK